ncbi:hypothetical protein [Veronia nyctiphanis]|uniref:hypothetical protein n=1 Tax=Veronia nyctiphanis TaxID=1278244 RepID=UPI001F2623B3|nr:hypothetical protein [Veronia nyctiphanis]
MTVRQRLLIAYLFFTLSVVGLGASSVWVSARSADASTAYLDEQLPELLLLTALEKDHRAIADLSQKIKAQLLFWNEVETQYDLLKLSYNENWTRLAANKGAADWLLSINDQRNAFDQYLEDLEKAWQAKATTMLAGSSTLNSTLRLTLSCWRLTIKSRRAILKLSKAPTA